MRPASDIGKPTTSRLSIGSIATPSRSEVAMLTKRKDRKAGLTQLQSLAASISAAPLDRRAFLRRSGLVAGGVAALGTIQLGTVRKASAISPPQPGVPIELKKSIC